MSSVNLPRTRKLRKLRNIYLGLFYAVICILYAFRHLLLKAANFRELLIGDIGSCFLLLFCPFSRAELWTKLKTKVIKRKSQRDAPKSLCFSSTTMYFPRFPCTSCQSVTTQTIGSVLKPALNIDFEQENNTSVFI